MWSSMSLQASMAPGRHQCKQSRDTLNRSGCHRRYLLGCASARKIMAFVVSISSILTSLPLSITTFAADANSSACSARKSRSKPSTLFWPRRYGAVRTQLPSPFHSPPSYCDGSTARSSAVPRNRLPLAPDSARSADIVFQVGWETLAVHRWLLVVRSPVFNAGLFGAMKESSTGVVLVDDMEAVVFRALLYFIYTDLLPEMNNGEEEYVMSQHLLVASDKYNLERLKFIWQQNLCKHIEASNVTFILELAEQHQCHALKNACFEFLSTPAHLEAALATDSFKHMSRNFPSIMMELVAKLGTQAAKPSNISSFTQFY